MTVMQKKRALFVQPSLQPPGGGNGVAAWMIQALGEEYAVTALTWAEVDVNQIDSHFGTTLATQTTHFVRAWPTLSRFARLTPIGLDLLKDSLLLRAAQRLAPSFDVVMGANNEVDYGRRGLQYVHYPKYLRPRPPTEARWFHVTPLLRSYYKTCETLANFDASRMRENVTWANSSWTAALLSKLHGIDATVVPPPVRFSATPQPWEDRTPRVLCVGRISPEKEIEKVISIVERARVSFPSLRLTVAGGPGPHAYMSRIAAMTSERAAWMDLRVDVPRAELEKLMATSQYGLQGMTEEHFGMAAGEMMAAGCLVFLPAGGGQVELVRGNSRFLYESADEAAAKLVAASHPEAAKSLLLFLAERGRAFGVDRFMSQVREAARTLAAGEN